MKRLRMTIAITRGSQAAFAWTTERGDLIVQGNDAELRRTATMMAAVGRDIPAKERARLRREQKTIEKSK
jgi:hypothetical protein